MNIFGIDPNKVWDSLEVPEFGLGQLGFAGNGAIYMFAKADGAVDASDAVIFNTDGTAAGLQTTEGAVGTGTGKMVGVAPADPSQTIADDDYFWACVFAPATAGVVVNVKASCEAFSSLVPTATVGHLDNALDVDNNVEGIVIVTAAGGQDEAEIAVINWPRIQDNTDA